MAQLRGPFEAMVEEVIAACHLRIGQRLGASDSTVAPGRSGKFSHMIGLTIADALEEVAHEIRSSTARPRKIRMDKLDLRTCSKDDGLSASSPFIHPDVDPSLEQADTTTENNPLDSSRNARYFLRSTPKAELTSASVRAAAYKLKQARWDNAQQQHMAMSASPSTRARQMVRASHAKFTEPGSKPQRKSRSLLGLATQDAMVPTEQVQQKDHTKVANARGCGDCRNQVPGAVKRSKLTHPDSGRYRESQPSLTSAARSRDSLVHAEVDSLHGELIEAPQAQEAEGPTWHQSRDGASSTRRTFAATGHRKSPSLDWVTYGPDDIFNPSTFDFDRDIVPVKQLDNGEVVFLPQAHQDYTNTDDDDDQNRDDSLRIQSDIPMPRTTFIEAISSKPCDVSRHGMNHAPGEENRLVKIPVIATEDLKVFWEAVERQNQRLGRKRIGPPSPVFSSSKKARPNGHQMKKSTLCGSNPGKHQTQQLRRSSRLAKRMTLTK